MGRLLRLVDGFHGGDREGSSTAFGAEGELMVMEAASKFCFLEMRGDVFVGHFVHASFYQVCFLKGSLVNLFKSNSKDHVRTSSSDQALPPPVEAARRWGPVGRSSGISIVGEQ